MNIVIEIVGYAGAAGILLAYFQAARGRWPASGLTSAMVNLASAVGLLVNAAHHRALPSVALNIAWLVIGGATVAHLLRARQSTPASATTTKT